MTKEARKRANAKYLGKMADIRLHVKKELKEKIKKAADTRNLSVTAFIIQCVNDKLSSDWIDDIIADTATEDKPQPVEKPKGWHIPLASNEKLREAGYDI